MQFFKDRPAVFTAAYPQPKPEQSGIWFDGTHLSDQDLSVWLISAALAFGAARPDLTDLEAWADLVNRSFEDLTDQEHEFLREASEEALTWLTCNVAPEDHVFYIEDSCVFLEAYGNTEG